MLKWLRQLKARFGPRSAYWKDVTWLASGTVAGQAVNLASLPIITRLYEPAAFANLALFTQIALILAIVITLRLEFAVPLPRRRIQSIAIVHLVALLALVGAALWTLLAWLTLEWTLHWLNAGTAAVLVVAPLGAALTSVAYAAVHMQQRLGGYRQVGLAEVQSKSVNAAAAAALYMVVPTNGLIWAFCLAAGWKTLTLAGGSAPGLVKRWFSRPAWRAAMSRRMRVELGHQKQMSASMMVSNLILTLTGLAPLLYIGARYGAEALGAYALVYSTSYLPSALVGAAVGQVYFQRIALAHAQSSAILPLWQSTARRLALFGVPVFAVFAAAAPWLYPVVFGSQWRQAGEFASIMALAAMVGFISTPLDRTCLVVRAWRYLPIWHSARLASTCLVLGVAHWRNWGVTPCIAALSIQGAALYLIDLLVQRALAARSGSRSGA